METNWIFVHEADRSRDQHVRQRATGSIFCCSTLPPAVWRQEHSHRPQVPPGCIQVFIWHSPSDIKHLCCILIMISITTIIIQIHIQIQANCHFGYKRVYKFLASVFGDTRRETEFLKAYANHTMLTLPACAAHLVVFKISIHFCRSRPPKIWSDLSKSEKLNRYLQRSTLTTVFSKSLNSQDHLLYSGRSHLSVVWMVLIRPLISNCSSPFSLSIGLNIICLGVYYDRWWLSYPFLAGVRLHYLIMHLG